MNTYWYAITEDSDILNEIEHGIIEAESIYDASRKFSSRYGIWAEHRRLYIFESEEAYIFYIKRNNLEWLDAKYMIRI